MDFEGQDMLLENHCTKQFLQVHCDDHDGEAAVSQCPLQDREVRSHQLWHVVKLSVGVYLIINGMTGFCLAAQDTGVIIKELLGFREECLWNFFVSNIGLVCIVSNMTKKCVSVERNLDSPVTLCDLKPGEVTARASFRLIHDNPALPECPKSFVSQRRALSSYIDVLPLGTLETRAMTISQVVIPFPLITDHAIPTSKQACESFYYVLHHSSRYELFCRDDMPITLGVLSKNSYDACGVSGVFCSPDGQLHMSERSSHIKLTLLSCMLAMEEKTGSPATSAIDVNDALLAECVTKLEQLFAMHPKVWLKTDIYSLKRKNKSVAVKWSVRTMTDLYVSKR